MSDMNVNHSSDEAGNLPAEGTATVKLTNVPAPQPSASGWTEVGEDWREVGEEFKKLGTRLSSAIRAGWKSDQDQQLNGLGDQLRAMADQVEAAARAARHEAQNPETKAQTRRVVEAAKEAQVTLVDEVRHTVADTLRTLNAQLRDLAERIENGRK
jgi:hypothetical protein